MKKTIKKISGLVMALAILLSVTAVYAAVLPSGTYNSDEFDIEFWKDDTTTLSMSDGVIVDDSQELEVNSNGGILTFDIQTIYIGLISGNMTEFSVDFDGDGIYTDATISNDTVTLAIPSSELTDIQHVYPAKVENDVLGIPMPSDIEFNLDLSEALY